MRSIAGVAWFESTAAGTQRRKQVIRRSEGTFVAGRADFTDQEWETMQKGVTGAGMLVSISDRSFFDTFKEAGALARHIAQARQNTTSDVVRELGATRGTGFGLTSSPAEVESETLDALRSAIATLQAKAPEEVDAYRSFVLEVAHSVAEAAGGGDVVESEAVGRVRSALEAA